MSNLNTVHMSSVQISEKTRREKRNLRRKVIRFGRSDKRSKDFEAFNKTQALPPDKSLNLCKFFHEFKSRSSFFLKE